MQVPGSTIEDLQLGPGEMSFTARIGDLPARRIWMRTDAPVTPTADAVLASCLMPAMRVGGKLTLPGEISPRLLRMQSEYQAIQRVWSRDWQFGMPVLSEVEVAAHPRRVDAPAPGRRVATFFSGGVDSWATVLGNPDATDLIFVRGMDLRLDDAGFAGDVEARLRAAAAEVGRSFHVVETNLRELSDPLLPWITFYGSALASVALFMVPLFERVLIAGASDYEVVEEFGATSIISGAPRSSRSSTTGDGSAGSSACDASRITP